MISSDQYLELAETSPGSVKPASVAMAMFARDQCQTRASRRTTPVCYSHDKLAQPFAPERARRLCLTSN